MLLKLYKYDMKSIIKEIGPIWMIVPVIAVIFGFSIKFSSESFDIISSWDNGLSSLMLIGSSMAPVISGMVLFAVYVAMFVLSILFVIRRFWKGLLGDEGYLMFTLPVKSRDLILSKAFSATTVSVISSVDAFISMFLIALVTAGPTNLFEGIRFVLKEVTNYLGILTLPYAVVIIIIGIISVAMEIYKIYAAMAIGQTQNKYRILMAGGCYIGINIVLSIISRIFIFAVTILGMAIDFDKILPRIIESPGVILGILTFSGVLTLILMIVFHIITNVIFDKRLNLE